MKFDFWVFGIFLAVVIALYSILFFRGVPVDKVFMKGLTGFATMIPLIALGFLMATAILQLIPTKAIIEWMGPLSGWKGYWIGSLVGSLTPGHPVVDFPIALGLLSKGAGVGTIISMFVASRLWNLQVLAFELSILGWQLTATRWIVCLIFPPLAGYLASLIFDRMAGWYS